MITVQDFNSWLDTAEPGDRLEYHRGHLARDRYDEAAFRSANRKPAWAKLNNLREDAMELQRVAVAATNAEKEGRIHLVQSKDADQYIYMAWMK